MIRAHEFEFYNVVPNIVLHSSFVAQTVQGLALEQRIFYSLSIDLSSKRSIARVVY